MSTTLTAIRDSLKATIRAIDPGGDPMGQGKYVITDSKFKWEERPNANFDRRITVADIKRGVPLFYGSTTDIDYHGTALVRVGHVIGSDVDSGIDRRDTDLDQIAAVLEKSSNFPAGVSIVRVAGPWGPSLPMPAGKFWLTTMIFDLTYSRLAP